MLRARVAALAASLAGLASWPASAAGGDLVVSPVVVDLGKARSALVTVRNAAPDRGRYQLRVYRWDESPLGEMRLEPASDLVVFPVVLDLAPGQERKLRVGTTAAPGEKERSWRVFLEEILPAVTQEEGNRVRTRLRIGIPVFLAPERTFAGAEIVGLGVDAGRVTFLMRNGGSVRIRTTEVLVTVADAAGATLFQKRFDGWYVLAGSDRLYDVEIPREACRKAAQVTAVATADQPLQATARIASGACAP
ncbi:MAG TPA: fimbria/pilus periplasmic chaperone [Anaeromyxobacteraceae bacterium]|nr:fimbria/pilus periplasmic chaperone [Anaeromyxobacteraceae bacterium]